MHIFLKNQIAVPIIIFCEWMPHWMPLKNNLVGEWRVSPEHRVGGNNCVNYLPAILQDTFTISFLLITTKKTTTYNVNELELN